MSRKMPPNEPAAASAIAIGFSEGFPRPSERDFSADALCLNGQALTL
jgi:hypothetical protein